MDHPPDRLISVAPVACGNLFTSSRARSSLVCALHTPWAAENPGRNPQKKPKDDKHGIALLNAVWVTMRHHVLDAGVYEGLPDDLKPHFEHWDAQKSRR